MWFPCLRVDKQPLHLAHLISSQKTNRLWKQSFLRGWGITNSYRVRPLANSSSCFSSWGYQCPVVHAKLIPPQPLASDLSASQPDLVAEGPPLHGPLLCHLPLSSTIFPVSETSVQIYCFWLKPSKKLGSWREGIVLHLIWMYLFLHSESEWRMNLCDSIKSTKSENSIRFSSFTTPALPWKGSLKQISSYGWHEASLLVWLVSASEFLDSFWCVPVWFCLACYLVFWRKCASNCS